MGKKLPYFPFYALDWITDPQVQGLSNEQRGIFHWLLCRQWLDDDLPEEPLLVYPLLPPGSDSNAVAYVLDSFFPIVGGGRRRNRRLSDIRDELEAKYAAKLEAAQRARGGKTKPVKQLRSVSSNVSPKGRIKNQTQTQTKEEDVGIPPLVWEALKPFAGDPKTRVARIGQVRGLLQGMTDKPVSPEAMARGLTDFLANGGNWSAIGIRAFALKAEKLLQGEAGRRAAQGDLSVLGQPDANTGQWSEDEVET